MEFEINGVGTGYILLDHAKAAASVNCARSLVQSTAPVPESLANVAILV